MRRQIGLLGLAFITALEMGGCGQSNSQESVVTGQARPLVSGSGSVSLTMQSEWDGGYCANVTLANQGSAPITSWTLVVQIPNASLSSLWSGQYTLSADQLTITPAAFNAIIPGGTSTSLGFCATTTSADHAPVIVSLDVVGGGEGGTGGAAGTGGAEGLGGGSEVGGEASTGGTSEVGGESSTGGASETGGVSATGGTSEVGGESATGGASETGGTSAAGGASETGGTSATGGLSATGGVSATGGTSSGGTSNAGKAVLDVNSDWTAGYCTNITLKNEGAVASTDWTLVLNVPNADIGNLWGATFTRAGNLVTVKPVGYAAVIPAGSSTSIGYCATTKGTPYTPSVVSFVLVTAKPAGTGGAASTGGAPSTGGVAATGGARPTGGSPGTGGTATGGTGGQSLVTATLTITSGSDWADGYCASVDVVNAGLTKVTNWTVAVNFPAANLLNLWNGTPTISGALMSVAAASYNQQIAPGASANFGFCAATTGPNHSPSIASVSATN